MSLYFGVFISLFAYLIGMKLKKKFGWPVLNPLLVAIILVIAFLNRLQHRCILYQLFFDTVNGLSCNSTV